MPVQINEMIIRANIVEGGANEGGNGKPPAQGPAEGESPAFNKDEIVKECTAMVLEIINNKNQR